MASSEASSRKLDVDDDLLLEKRTVDAVDERLTEGDDRGRGVGRRREGVSEGVVDEGARNDGGRNREMKFLRRMES